MDDVTFCKLHTLHWRSGNLTSLYLAPPSYCVRVFLEYLFLIPSSVIHSFVCSSQSQQKKENDTTINGSAPLNIEYICWRAMHTSK